MKSKKILLTLRDNPFFWNMAASTLVAFQSALLLIVVTRAIGLDQAGAFTFAFSLAQMFQTIALFDMRSFQVSDVRHRYDFSDYLISRFITCSVMMIIAFLYVLIMGYDSEKRNIILALCLFKDIEAMEDVLHGYIQSEGRLDLAAKNQVLRCIISMLLFTAVAIISHTLLLSVLTASFASCLITLGNITILRKLSHPKITLNIKSILTLLFACSPLFIGSFLAIYLENAPKLAIDRFLTSAEQARYGIIAMLAFVVNLFSSFAFRPLLTPLADCWNEHNYSGYSSIISKLFLWILALFIVCEAGAYLLGVPILEIVYGIELADLKLLLVMVILGGTINASGTILYHSLTCMRKQNWILVGQGIAAAGALFTAPILVQSFGLVGASLTLIFNCSLKTIIFLCVFFHSLKQARSMEP